MPYQWLTPDLPTPDNRRGRCFSVPDDVQLVAAVSGALLPLTYAASWEKFGSMTPDEAAAIMSAAFEDFVSDEKGDCKGIPSIQGKRLVRLSPTTKKWQQIAADGETWEDPTGDLEVPAQTGRSEPTDEEKICGAATNAAHVLHLLYDEALELYENEIDPAAALDFWGDYAGEIIFEALGLLVSHFAPLVGYMWTTLYGIMEILTYDAWSDTLEGNLVCLLIDNAAIADGVVTFDYPAVQTGLFVSGHTAKEDLLVLGQVWYFLSIIGADGLNLAGETTSEEGACDCGNWCFESDDWRLWERMRGGLLQNGNGKVIPTTGNAPYSSGITRTEYAEYRLRVPTNGAVITEFGVLFGCSNARNYAFVPVLSIGDPDDTFDSRSEYWPANYAVPVWKSLTSLSVELWQTEFYAAFVAGASYPEGCMLKWRVKGTGINPFEAWEGDVCSG